MSRRVGSRRRTGRATRTRQGSAAEVHPLEPRMFLTAAFPGAAGPAMHATGGRGGDVYHVTNLTDGTTPQPGSLRYGIQTAPSSGRTIVFDVGGTIRLAPNRNGWLEIGKSNITIAGQTAPGGGVTIMGNVTKVTGSNIVLRHLKFRPKLNATTPDGLTKDALWLTGNNIIVDHVSASWYDDEGISSSDAAGNITVQYALLGEGLNYNGHGYGAIIGSDVTNSQIAYHHVLFAHHKSRLPRLGNETSAVNYVEFSNNVVYNWQSSEAGYSGGNDSNDQPIPGGQFARANFVGNTYVYGNSAGTRIFQSAGTNTHIYQSGNELDPDKDGALKDGRAVVWSDFQGTETQIATRFDIPGITYETADAALDNTLDRGGAFWWARDAVDARLVNETRTGTGNVVSTANATEWNNAWNAPAVTRPAGWDTDGDGMPNDWEAANGLDPASAADGAILNPDGYTNLDRYLQFAARDVEVTPPPDSIAPTSSVAPLPATTTAAAFTVSWSGTDNTGGSGLANYDVYVSTDGGAFTLWQNATAATSATFTGVNGSQYRFYSRARDSAGNLEPAPATPDATTTVQVSELAAWWKLDEAAGANVPDSSGNNYTGTANGPAWVGGKFGNALSFDGVNDVVTLPNSIANTAAGSVAMWIKTGATFTDSAHLFYTSTTTDGNGGGSHNELHLNFLNTNQLQFFIEGGSLDVNVISPSTYNDNAWHHVAATWDVNGNAVLYVDGAPVGSAVHNASTFTGSATTLLGRPAAITRHYAGLMDDVRLYNVPLTAAQIQALYAEVPPSPPPAWLAPGSAAAWNADTKTLTVTGPATIIADPAADAPLIVASTAAAILTLNPATDTQIHIGGITLANGATATLTDAPSTRVLVISAAGALSITAGSTLDLTDNALVLDYAAASTHLRDLTTMVATAAGPECLWSGTGITSSTARARATRQSIGPATTLAVSEASIYKARTGQTTFAGVAIDDTAVLVKYTHAADATLDGRVSDKDADVLYANYQDSRRPHLYTPFVTTRVFTDADFTYDGMVDDRDLDLFAAAISTTLFA